jgi:hypothetical protein
MAQLLDELASVLEVFMFQSCSRSYAVIGGDISFHMHDNEDPYAKRCMDMISTLDMGGGPALSDVAVHWT